MGGGYPPSQLGLDGVPPPTRTGWGTPPGQDWMGYPPIRQSSKVSTCYAAGSVPLAFTQEDFLVEYNITTLFSMRQVFLSFLDEMLNFITVS